MVFIFGPFPISLLMANRQPLLLSNIGKDMSAHSLKRTYNQIVPTTSCLFALAEFYVLVVEDQTFFAHGSAAFSTCLLIIFFLPAGSSVATVSAVVNQDTEQNSSKLNSPRTACKILGGHDTQHGHVGIRFLHNLCFPNSLPPLF